MMTIQANSYNFSARLAALVADGVHEFDYALTRIAELRRQWMAVADENWCHRDLIEDSREQKASDRKLVLKALASTIRNEFGDGRNEPVLVTLANAERAIRAAVR